MVLMIYPVCKADIVYTEHRVDSASCIVDKVTVKGTGYMERKADFASENQTVAQHYSMWLHSSEKVHKESHSDSQAIVVDKQEVLVVLSILEVFLTVLVAPATS